MTEFFFALIGAALISHLFLDLPLAAESLRSARMQALGPCAAAMIALAVPLAWLIDGLLQALALPSLFLLTCIPALAVLAWCVPRLLARWRAEQPGLWLILLGNGLGAMLLARALESFATALVLGLVGGLGFWLVLQLLDDLRARIEACDVPATFRGTPIMLIGAGLMSLAFLGFNGMEAP